MQKLQFVVLISCPQENLIGSFLTKSSAWKSALIDVADLMADGFLGNGVKRVGAASAASADVSLGPFYVRGCPVYVGRGSCFPVIQKRSRCGMPDCWSGSCCGRVCLGWRWCPGRCPALTRTSSGWSYARCCGVWCLEGQDQVEEHDTDTWPFSGVVAAQQQHYKTCTIYNWNNINVTDSCFIFFRCK